jgi:predicted TIM-barrel fold metal-dependent hydrolase
MEDGKIVIAHLGLIAGNIMTETNKLTSEHQRVYVTRWDLSVKSTNKQFPEFPPL